MKEKRTMTVVVLSTLLLITLIIGGSYAYWKVTRGQEDANTLTTTCLDIDLSSTTSGINLDTQFPIPEEEGRATTGYTFKITNKCDTYVSYDINLESLNTVAEENRLNLSYLDAILDDGNVLDLGSYPSTEESSNSYDTRTLTTDTIGPKDSATSTKEYTLRVWLDESASNETMNKRWSGRISVSASPVIAENAVEKLTKLAKTNTTEMFIDDTEDANIRYMGTDPSNYIDLGNGYYSEDLYRGYYAADVHSMYEEYTSLEACQTGIEDNIGIGSKFNIDCEKIYSKGDPILWRVIGVMNNVDDGTGNKETRLKIIRDGDIGIYSFSEVCSDSELYPSGQSCKVEHYNNNWATSNLQEMLNSGYLNKTTAKAYNSVSMYTSILEKRNSSFTNVGIPEKTRILIGDAVYHLGGPAEDNYITATAKSYYDIERSEVVNEGNATTWIGKVGLMYPSDYGYATSGGTTDKTVCEAKELALWSIENDDCGNNDWLNKNASYQWTITHLSNNVLTVLYVSNEFGNVDWNYTLGGIAARPVLYLKSEVKIMGGNGTKESPYKLGL